jgi:hypothetical protein
VLFLIAFDGFYHTINGHFARSERLQKSSKNFAKSRLMAKKPKNAVFITVICG